MGTSCQVSTCKYYSQKECGLNLKGPDVVVEQCKPTDNWYVVGSFVLDQVFRKKSARDIDLVMPWGEMPAALPDEVTQSKLPIEMIWRHPQDRRGFDFYNISMIRQARQGLGPLDLIQDITEKRVITLLPRVRKVTAATIFVTIKSMVKYDLEIDQKVLRAWTKSILDPLRWKQPIWWWLSLRIEKRESIDWDAERAEHLIDWLERVYSKNPDYERREYLERLYQILQQIPLDNDFGYQLLREFVTAWKEGREAQKQNVKQVISDRREERRRLAGWPLYRPRGGSGDD